jgi:hypothetical protein
MTLMMVIVTIVGAVYSWTTVAGNGKIMRIRDMLDHDLQYKKC